MNRSAPVEEELVLSRFAGLRKAVIDTSSLIQAEKAGFLNSLASAVDLVSVEDVRTEYLAGREAAILPRGILFVPGIEGKTTDIKVVSAAEKFRLPLVSEDRKILLRAEKREIDYYNVLMMLELLLFKGAVDMRAYEEFRGRLFENARYTPWVKSYAERIHWEIRKRL